MTRYHEALREYYAGDRRKEAELRRHLQHCEFEVPPSPKVENYSISPDRKAVTLRFDRALDRHELLDLLHKAERLQVG